MGLRNIYTQGKSPSQEVFPPVSHGKAISGILLRKQVSPLRGESTYTNVLASSFRVTAPELVQGYSFLIAKASETIAGIWKLFSGCVKCVCCCVCT